MSSRKDVLPYEIFSLRIAFVSCLWHCYALKYCNATLWFEQLIHTFEICAQVLFPHRFEHLYAHHFVITPFPWYWQSSIITKQNFDLICIPGCHDTFLCKFFLFSAQSQGSHSAPGRPYCRDRKASPTSPNLQDMIRRLYTSVFDESSELSVLCIFQRFLKTLLVRLREP